MLCCWAIVTEGLHCNWSQHYFCFLIQLSLQTDKQSVPWHPPFPSVIHLGFKINNILFITSFILSSLTFYKSIYIMGHSFFGLEHWPAVWAQTLSPDPLSTPPKFCLESSRAEVHMLPSVQTRDSQSDAVVVFWFLRASLNSYYLQSPAPAPRPQDSASWELWVPAKEEKKTTRNIVLLA